MRHTPRVSEPPSPTPVAIGLGTNVGDRRAQLEAALARLADHVDALRCARVYASDAMLPPGAPPGWARPYLNTVCVGATRLTPAALLAETQAIERALGRGPHPRWAPRVIDLDVLLYGDRVIGTPALTVPHPGLAERAFVVLPLAEVAPDWRHPISGERVAALAEALRAAHPDGMPHRTRVVGDAVLWPG